MTNLLGMLLLAQVPAVPNPPVSGRPLNFSGLVGFWRIDSQADRKEVRVEEPLLLTIALQGQGPVGPAGLPDQAALNIFPKTAHQDFFIDPVPEMKTAAPERNVWTFVWRLRPRHRKVTEIPGLELAYWYPARTRYQRSYADPLPLKVLPPAASEVEPPTAKTVQFPPEAFELLFTVEDLRRGYEPWAPNPLLLVAGSMLPPAVCLLLLAFRGSRSATTARKNRERSEAAKQALKRLESERAPETVSAILATYLHARFDFGPREASPAEVTRFLACIGLDRNALADWRKLLQDCDAARFGRRLDLDLADQGRRVLEGTESSLEKLPSRPPLRRRPVPLSVGLSFGIGWAASAIAANSSTDPGAVVSREALLDRARLEFRKAARDDLVDRNAAGKAADGFASLLGRGIRHPDLHHDLGNALLLAGRLPEAVLHYRLGLEMAPDHDALRQRLEFARAQVLYGRNDRGRPPRDRWPDWLPRPTLGLLVGSGLLAHACCWGFLTRWYLTRGRGWFLGAVTALAIVVAAVVAASAMEVRARQGSLHPIVVLAEETEFRTGNAPSFPLHADLPVLGAGMEARLMHGRGDWAMLRFDGGEIGWVPVGQLLRGVFPAAVRN